MSRLIEPMRHPSVQGTYGPQTNPKKPERFMLGTQGKSRGENKRKKETDKERREKEKAEEKEGQLPAPSAKLRAQAKAFVECGGAQVDARVDQARRLFGL